MVDSDLTCWTVIRGAAKGRAREREDFVRRYAPVIRAYLGARWRARRLAHEMDDAVQEVFVDCFRDGGAHTRAEPRRSGGVRAFLYGVTRNVARALVRQAAGHQAREAPEKGEDAVRRIDLLRLPFEEGIPIRDIARRWREDPARLHHEFARARQEFRAAPRAVVLEHHPGLDGRLDDECARVLASLR